MKSILEENNEMVSRFLREEFGMERSSEYSDSFSVGDFVKWNDELFIVKSVSGDKVGIKEIDEFNKEEGEYGAVVSSEELIPIQSGRGSDYNTDDTSEFEPDISPDMFIHTAQRIQSIAQNQSLDRDQLPKYVAQVVNSVFPVAYAKAILEFVYAINKDSE